jgi:hypothetical protein
MGFLDKVKEATAIAQQRLAAQKERESLRATIVPTITVSTSAIQEKYKVIDVVFAFDSHEPGSFSSFFGGGAKPSAAFDRVSERLRNACFNVGGDAVISCQFEYRFATTSGLFGSKPLVEIYAYGTAVTIEE